MSANILAAVIKQASERGFDYEQIVPNHRISWGNSKLKKDGIASLTIIPCFFTTLN